MLRLEVELLSTHLRGARGRSAYIELRGNYTLTVTHHGITISPRDITIIQKRKFGGRSPSLPVPPTGHSRSSSVS